MEETKLNPRVIVIIGVFFTSLSAIFVRLSSSPALVVALYRMLFTTLLLTPSFIIRLKTEKHLLGKRELLLCLVSGIFLALHFAVWFYSLRMTSIASATVLVDMHPVFVLLGGLLFLKESTTKRAVIFVVMSLAGSVVLSLSGITLRETAVFGNILALLGAVFVAGYMLIGRMLRQKLSLGVYTFLVYMICTFFLALAVLLSDDRFYPYPPREWLIFLGLAVFCTLLGHSVFNWALRYLKTTFVSTSILGEPVIATILAIFIFSEIPTIIVILGGIVVLIGIYLLLRYGETKKLKS